MMTKELHDLLQLPLAERSKLICKKTDRTVNDERYAEALAGLRTALHAFDGLYYPSGDLGFDNAVTTVYACVRVLAESVASLPLKLYEKTANGRLEAVDNPLHDLLTVSPNEEMNAFTFWETMVGCLALTGNCYAEIICTKGGQIDSLYLCSH